MFVSAPLANSKCNLKLMQGIHTGLGCISAWLHGCMATWLHGCMAAWLHGCMAVWLHGCMAAWLHGCMGAWVHGCMGVLPHYQTKFSLMAECCLCLVTLCWVSLCWVSICWVLWLHAYTCFMLATKNDIFVKFLIEICISSTWKSLAALAEFKF